MRVNIFMPHENILSGKDSRQIVAGKRKNSQNSLAERDFAMQAAQCNA